MINFIKSKLKSFLVVLMLIGPGVIAAAVGNDAGGIATYSVAGARYGYSMLWLMLPIAFLLIVVQEMCARMGVVSGKGLADLIRESYGAKIAFYILAGLLVANLATVVSEFAGIAGSMEIFGVKRYVAVPVGAVLIWWVITKGNYRSAEKICLVGAVLYISYVVSGFLADPSWTEVLGSVIKPNIELTKPYFFMVVGIIGTTIAPWMQFYLQSSVVEKGLKKEDYKFVKLDVVVGSIAASFVAFFIIVASAATLFKHGIVIEDAVHAAAALAPFAGKFAESLFAFGLLNASLLGAMIVPLSSAYYICEGLGFESGVNKSFREAPWFNGIFTAIILMGSIPALFPQMPLVKVMLVAQVVSGVLLAPVLIFILLLINKKWLMGDMANKPWQNVVAGLSVFVLIALSGIVVFNALM